MPAVTAVMVARDGEARPSRTSLFYAGGALLLFLPLYLITRSPFLASDGTFFLELARRGDVARPTYGEVGHFLQLPLSHTLWSVGRALGLELPFEAVYLGIGLAGALAAIVFVGLIAGELLGTVAARWVAGLLYGTSLAAWIHWNGELYALAAGFLTAAVYTSLRGHLVLPAALFALSVVSHSEFALTAPVFLVGARIASPADGLRRCLARGLLIVGLATVLGTTMLLTGGWLVGRWHDVTTLRTWFFHGFSTRQAHIGGLEPLRAAKGLLTAYTVGGHVAGDLMRGRIGERGPAFTLGAALALPVVVATVALAVSAARQRMLFVLGLAWLLPLHVLFNWRLFPTDEEYHSAVLPALVLLVTAGLVGVLRTRRGGSLAALYVALCIGLNLFGGILPVKAQAEEAISGARALATLEERAPNGAAFVSCDDDPWITLASVEYLRIRVLWTRSRSVPDIERQVGAWVSDRLSRGKSVYVVGRSCPLQEWSIDAPQATLELAFLDRQFQLTASPVQGLLQRLVSATNPFRWKRVDVYHLASRT